MANQNVQRILQDIRSLTPDEQTQPRALMDGFSPKTFTNVIESKLDAALLEKGIILEALHELSPAQLDRLHAWTPAGISGQPLSHTISEDRR